MPQYRTAWPPLTENIKITLAILVAFFLAGFEFTGFVEDHMLVSSRDVLVEYEIWTIFTYAFWHFDFGHLLFNGIALWMFGGELDQRWGTQKFWTVSLLSALGGGVAVVLTQFASGGVAPTLGYSGAVMGLVGAFCWYAWDRTLYFFFFPMSGKSLLAFFLVIDFARVFIGGAPVSIAAHMGGLIVGLLAATGWWRPKRAKRAYKQWKRRRDFQSRSGGGPRWN